MPVARTVTVDPVTGKCLYPEGRTILRVLTDATLPFAVPAYIGEPGFNEDNGFYYISTGLTAGDWDQAAQGPTGAAATIAVGTTSTLPAGSSATVTNSGTSSAAVFDFEIPKGDTGSTGPANSLSIGTVTEGPASATITGTAPSQTLNLVIPKGNKGDNGDAATIAVGTVSTVSPSDPATVVNSGTSSAAVFDFEIPRGPTGPTGSAATISIGTVDTVGPSDPATVTNSGTSSAAVFDFEIPKGPDGLTYVPLITLTDAATVAWDMSLGSEALVTLAGNRTIGNPTNIPNCASGNLRVLADATGGRIATLGSNWIVPDGAANSFTVPAGKFFLISFTAYGSSSKLVANILGPLTKP